MKYKTIKDFHEAVKCGEINEIKLTIVLDNDCTLFYLDPIVDGDEPDHIEVSGSNGYYDIESLYSILFPEARVEWC